MAADVVLADRYKKNRIVIPAKAGIQRLIERAKKALDPSFRWDDECLAVSARHAEIFSEQPWANARIRRQCPDSGID
jgi:hypothetical protein